MSNGTAKVIAACQGKGGTGKSVVCINLSAYLALHYGKRVLAIDLDAQGNLGIGLGVDVQTVQLTTFHLLSEPSARIEDYIVTARPNLDLIPNAINSKLENALDIMPGRDTLLKRKLKTVLDSYDYIILDTPPAMRVPTNNAIVAADEIIIVCDCGYFGMYGLSDLLAQIADIQAAHDNNGLVIRGLLNRYQKGELVPQDIMDQLREFFGGLMLQTVVHKNTSIERALSHRQPVIEYDKAAPAHFDFMKLTQELLDEHGQETTRRDQTTKHRRR